jgi:arginine exporter protein ArgO
VDELTLNEAVENISLIKGMIDRTSKSFTAFSKIFIYWGLLFILNSVITVVMMANRERLMELSMKYPLGGFIFPIGIIALLAFIIYRAIAAKIPLVGLEKHLMKVWLLILAMNVIPPKVSVDTAMNVGSVGISYNNLSPMLFSLAIALIVTSLFTGYKQFSYIGLIYIVISVLHAYFNLFMLNPLFQLLAVIALPFTFLYTGFFLKSQQAGGN